MKTMITAILFTGVVACCIAKPIPESANLDPDKYTIQFTLASVDENFMKGTNGYFSESDMKSIEEVKQMVSPLGRLQNSNVSYTDFATAHYEIGDDFTSQNSLVNGKVKLSDDQRGELSFILKYEDKDIALDKFPVELNEWTFFMMGDGGKPSHLMLIKLYPPKE